MTSPEVLQLIQETRDQGRNKLDLRNQQIFTFPNEIIGLTNLTYLDLSNTPLTDLPSDIGKLTNLTSLYLDNTRLTRLPDTIGNLTKLVSLDLSNTDLTYLPPTIGQLVNLTSLYLDNTKLTDLPSIIGRLTKLNSLYLNNVPLTCLPDTIGQLVDLTSLYLSNTQLTELPRSIGTLKKLTSLYLNNTQLTFLPDTIGQLVELTSLYLSNTQLTELPPSIGNLNMLTHLYLDASPVISPPPEIIEQGTKAVLAFLREELAGGRQQWVSKLLIVGEGGVGKTQMKNILVGNPFDPDSSTTHGIEIDKLKFSHPTENGVEMTLNSWDFGGQVIYHATHQFFLTNRSLFLLVWNARLGYEQGKLHYWLDMIQARAPESPILLIATHIDERSPDYPYSELRQKYRQIIGHCFISNKTGVGFAELRQLITGAAAELPLMGERWPAKWLNAAESIRRRSERERYISPAELFRMMRAPGVTLDHFSILAQWMHELGDILYFKDDEELNNEVILKPQWVSEYISKVLESQDVEGKLGILTRQHLDELWNDLEPHIRDHFLRLMEKFDLSYRIMDNKDISLVVERLKHDPGNFEKDWDSLTDYKETSMKFQINAIPPGIPTWFIARAHRFSIGVHWRTGGVFSDHERKHLALVQTFPYERFLRLTVRGPVPHYFFSVLRDTLELTLARYPGLDIKRSLPCPGHNGRPCSWEFGFDQVLKAIAQVPPVKELQCPESFKMVSTFGLLYGLHWRTQDEIVSRLEDMKTENHKRHQELLHQNQELVALVQREFLKQFHRDQSLIESDCPNIFYFEPLLDTWKAKTTGGKIRLYLCCQEPGHWHSPSNGGQYEITVPAEWLRNIAPYVKGMIKFLKFVAPFIGPVAGMTHFLDSDVIKNDVKAVEELVKVLPSSDEATERKMIDRIQQKSEPQQVFGDDLRSLRKMLETVDPGLTKIGLRKILTPEGIYLWLCEEHVKQYELS